MKVLVACPAHREMLFDRAMRSVLDLRWNDGRQIDIVFLVDGDGGSRWENLCRKLQRARQMALEGGYEVLVTIESDIIVPWDALEMMAAIEADVVYGLFVLRFPPYHWNVALEMRPQGHIELLSSDPPAARAAWAQVMECEGHGQGICFIHRHVLEQVEFRNPKPRLYAQDWFFSFDCQDLGFVQKIDLGLVCGHIDGDRILWPDPDEEKLYRQEST